MIAANVTQVYTGVLTPDVDLRQVLFRRVPHDLASKERLPQLAHIAKRLQGMGIEPMSNILDCFGGAGSAMMLCSGQYGGHNVVTIELAAHFRHLQAQAWQHFQCSLDMADIYGTPPGVFVSLAGDSREIPLVLFAANHDLEYVTDTNGLVAPCIIVTFAHLCQQLHSILEEAKRFFARQGLLARFAEAGMREGGQLDTVITSPPYHDSLTGQNGIDAARIKSRYGKNTQALLSTSYDAIVTSPSYGGSEAVDKRKTQNSTIAAHGGGNLAKLRYDKDEMARNGDVKHGYRVENGYKNIDFHKGGSLQVHTYNTDNIGNESGQRYLASMAQVWRGAAAVLRPGGVLVCITRDCVKQGKRVPVGEQNRALIEAAGLVFVACETWKVARPSFWRILQARKNPDAPIIDEEDVMYFRKP